MPTTYTAKDITVLEGLEPVRKRPGMYIGGVSSAGLHHLVWEILDNSIDEAMNGYASNIVVTLHKDGSSITIADDESNRIALSLDGRWLSVGGETADGSHATKIWDLDPEHWVDAACRVAGRNLTRYEWNDLIGNLV